MVNRFVDAVVGAALASPLVLLVRQVDVLANEREVNASSAALVVAFALFAFASGTRLRACGSAVSELLWDGVTASAFACCVTGCVVAVTMVAGSWGAVPAGGVAGAAVGLLYGLMTGILPLGGIVWMVLFRLARVRHPVQSPRDKLV